MKYLMLVCTDPDYTPGQDDGAPDVEDWVTDMDGKGIRVMGNRTRPASDATTVRVRNREVLLTDGPYAETKDLIAGFHVLECADLDEAIEVAKYLATVVGKAHGRQMDKADRKNWLRALTSSRSKSLDAPSWLWSSVVALVASHETAYLEHCRRYALAG